MLIKVLEPFHVRNDWIARVSILGIEGEADVSKGREINDIIKVINGIKAIKGKESLCEEKGGETPDIEICFRNDDEKILYSISFYGSVLRYNNTYYKIIGQEIQYSKIRKLCDKYGRVSESSPIKKQQQEGDDNMRKAEILKMSVVVFLFLFLLSAYVLS